MKPESIHTMKACRGIRLRWVVNFTGRPLYHREIIPVHIKWKAVGTTEADWTVWRKHTYRVSREECVRLRENIP